MRPNQSSFTVNAMITQSAVAYPLYYLLLVFLKKLLRIERKGERTIIARSTLCYTNILFASTPHALLIFSAKSSRNSKTRKNFTIQRQSVVAFFFLKVTNQEMMKHNTSNIMYAFVF
uniref:Uncharacterized protein n=1 Tax=Trypanosoma congolense (strain IL3000) TaxID=1068625 RepID=G0UR24_TRYCI|nr:hypothetical protein, unlikely [Trypanosoma congolense IL3000]